MGMNFFERPSLTEIAYEEIKKSICSGEFYPGYKLVVDDLVKSYNISNTPIKEALNRLTAEGFVETLPRRGMQVKIMGQKEIKELYDIRLMYEMYCARKALKVIDGREDVKAELLNTINAFEQLIESHSSYDYDNHSKLDREFHLAIVSLSGNETLIKEYEKINAINMGFKNYACRELPLKRCGESLKEHKAIYEALVEKDLDKLMYSIENHITIVMNDMLRFANSDE